MSDDWVYVDLGIERDAWKRGNEQGRKDERAAIVAWLSRGEVCPSPQVLAELIERGEHMGGDDE